MRSTRLLVPLPVLLPAVPAIAATVTVEGKDFGGSTCCKDLKKQILSGCGQ
jgi:hypothetical protein